jgi:hypothetical protein
MKRWQRSSHYKASTLLLLVFVVLQFFLNLLTFYGYKVGIFTAVNLWEVGTKFQKTF